MALPWSSNVMVSSGGVLTQASSSGWIIVVGGGGGSRLRAPDVSGIMSGSDVNLVCLVLLRRRLVAVKMQDLVVPGRVSAWDGQGAGVGGQEESREEELVHLGSLADS
ncbi:hypothetical protein PG990_002780 [Apiospora arundinis]|uniref:Uncharacterized protein n=1 Tax=Apiospora arundinis TaxID=335852 RepID=A0ABR2IHT2_9PEZI